MSASRKIKDLYSVSSNKLLYGAFLFGAAFLALVLIAAYIQKFQSRQTDFDVSGNKQEVLGTTTITNTITLNPIADTYVKSSNPTSNYGSKSTLYTNNSPSEISYLKFDLTKSGISPASQVTASLRLRISDSSKSTQSIKYVSDSSWNENSITYNSRPAAGSVAGSITNVSSGKWKSINVSTVISAHRNSLITLAIDSTGSDALKFYSRESSSYKPQLVVTYTKENSTTPTATPTITSTPTVSPTPTSTSNTSIYKMNVLVLKYFPVTADGQNIDISVTGDWGASYATTRQNTIDYTNRLVAAFAKASKYLGYKNSNSVSSLTYSITDTKEYKTAVPMLQNGSRKPDYNQILLDQNICDYVENKGVSEVWLWAYQGPTYPGSSYPYLNIAESKMSGPYGDISNSYRENNMPLCKKTYRVYTFNYQRGTGSAFHSIGHQMEAEFDAVDSHTYRTLWQGSAHPQINNLTGRCGSVHNPPNSRSDYDWANSTPQKSDCLDWKPDGTGTLTDISCNIWGCADAGDNNNPEINYLIWNLQNLPGYQNGKTYQSRPLRNWWDVHADFDNVMKNSHYLITP